MWWLWSLRGPIAEGRRRLESALAGDTRPTPTRAMALTGACDLAVDDDDEEAGRRLAVEALELHRALGSVTRMNDETLAIIGGRLDDRRIAMAREQDRTLTADEAVALALDALD